MEEQWKSNGICAECRRKNYCNKQCKANYKRLQKEVKGRIIDKMKAEGWPAYTYLSAMLSITE